MMDPRVVAAVIKQESGGNPNAVSPAGAQGIMQIMPDTARQPGYGVRPLQGWDGVNPKTAPVAEQIRFGSDYLAAMQKEFGNDPTLMLAAYNAGPGAVEKHGGVPPYAETQNYVRSVGANMASTSSWRDRATAVPQNERVPVEMLGPGVEEPADVTSDWRSRAKPVQVQKSFSDRMSENIANRTKQMQQSADAYVADEQGLISTGYQQAVAGASILPDTIGAGVAAVTPQPIKNIGAALLSGGKTVLENTVGKLPVAGGGTLASEIPQEMTKIEEGATPLARNMRAAGQAVNLVGAAQGLNVGAQLLSKGAVGGAKATAEAFRTKPIVTQDDIKRMAGESYDEAAYLGADFAPDQLANKLTSELKQLKPKPIAGKVLTSEDETLIRALDEFSGLNGQKMTLDDLKRLDESLTQKITTSFVDKQTGLPDANGRKLQMFQQRMRNIADDVPDTPGNDALYNGRKLWAAQRMLGDLDAIAERASMTRNPDVSMQTGYRNLYMDKDRIRGWPEEAKQLLKQAGKTGFVDDLLVPISSRLAAIGNAAMGNFAGAATAQALGMAARGSKEALVARRGIKVQRAITDDVASKLRAVNIPAPQAPQTLQLAAPGKLSPLPMSDTEINISQALMSRPANSTATAGAAMRPPVSQVTKLEGSLRGIKRDQFNNMRRKLADGEVSQNSFVQTSMKSFGLNRQQSRDLVKEILKYGDTQ